MVLLRSHWELLKIVVLQSPGRTNNSQWPIGNTGRHGKHIHIDTHKQITKSCKKVVQELTRTDNPKKHEKVFTSEYLNA